MEKVKVVADVTRGVVPCQLIDPDSGREVVVEILLTLLASKESTKVEVA